MKNKNDINVRVHCRDAINRVSTMNQTNTPTLRFPKFKGEWEKKKLWEISDFISKGTTPNKFVNEGVRFIKIECFDGDKINADKCLFIDEQTHNKELKRSILQENDLLFAIAGATIGKVNFVAKEILPANTNQALAIVRLKNTEIRNYIYQILKSDRMQKYISDSISVGAQPNLNLEQMNNFSFYLPSLPEQTKIANFLTAVDEKIQALKKKKSLLENYKKGVMQKLFCLNHDSLDLHDEHDLEGEKNQGNQENQKKSRFRQLRFRQDNGEDFPKWEVKKLGEVCEIKKGEQLNKEELTEFGSYPCLNGGVSFSGYTEKFNSEENTITISEGGNSCGYINFLNTKFWLGGHCYKIVFTKELNKNYFYQLLKFNEQRIMNLRVGSGLPNIQQKDIRNFEFVISNSLPEQTKIANFLSSIDEKITNVELQITNMQVWKKGLLQKMFV